MHRWRRWQNNKLWSRSAAVGGADDVPEHVPTQPLTGLLAHGQQSSAAARAMLRAACSDVSD